MVKNSIFYLVTDFAYIHHWILDTITKKAQLNTKATGEMHVSRVGNASETS